MKKNLLMLLFLICLIFGSKAQIAVTVSGTAVTTPALSATYPSLSAALTALNAVTAFPTPGNIVFTCAAGSSETAPAAGLTIGSATLNPLLSSTNTVTIIKSGGVVTLNAGTGVNASPSTATPDCILKLSGADWITIDGLTFNDGNAASATVAMEIGVGLFKLSVTDGCQNNTIQNCTFNLQRISNGSGTSPLLDGANAIELLNSTAAAATTALTPTAASGSNSNNKFYSNTINGGNIGIGLSGYAATLGVGPAPVAGTFLGDLNNDIGGSSAGTGNTILNYGGGAATNPAAAIRANNQWSVNISYNTINNNNGSGVNHATTLRGIYAQAGTSASATVSNNTISVQSGATTSACNAIENAIGSTAASNTINITNNTINVGYPTATSGVYTAILNSSTAATVNINGNIISQIAAVVFGGTGTHVIIEGGSPTTLNTNNNSVTNITRNGASGSWRGIKATTPATWNCGTNTVDGLSWSLAASTGSIDAIYDLSSGPAINLTNNIVRNLSTPSTGTINGININTVSGTHTCTGNQVYNFSTTAGGAGGATFTGIVFSVGNVTISGNLVYSLNSTGTTGGTGGAVTGIRQGGGTTNSIFKNKIYDLSSTSTGATIIGINPSGGTTNTIYNNLIGDLRAPAANLANAIRGIDIASTNANIYYNTVLVNATSAGAVFGTTALNTSSSTNLDMRNNILVNLSTANTTGLTVAYRRSTTTLTSYLATSNNNLLYAGAPSATNLIYYDGTNADQTLAAYKSRVTPRDAASVTENPTFVSTSGSSANFLHINTSVPTQVESGGITISGITDDYDGDIRNVSSPDLGADEGTFILSDINAPSISYTPLGAVCDGSINRTLTTTISDASGVPQSGAGLPVLYWKINAGSYTPVTATWVSGNTYTFSFGAGAATNDIVSYYIVAQDNVGTPNVGAFPSAGASGFTVNPPAASTPPTNPSTYAISSTLTGTYNVGTGQTYTTLTSAVNAYNTSCLSGPVTFLLTDAAYTTTSDTIRVNATASATNTLTIKPTLPNTTITGNSANATVVILGGDYVKIDGSTGSVANTVCPPSSASRDLTIINTNTGTTSAVIWLTPAGTDGASNNTIQNCNIVGNSPTTTLIGVGSGGAIGSASGAANNNNRYINNNISKVVFGIASFGTSIAVKNTGTVINLNQANTASPNNISRGGIYAAFEDGIIISGNNISNISGTTSNYAMGISAGLLSFTTTTTTGNEVTNASITKNVIGSVRPASTYGVAGIGVASAASGTNLIADNMISDAMSNGTSSDIGAGIYIGGGAGTTNVYFNTVQMAGTLTGGSYSNFGVAVNGSNPLVDLKNNIITNTGSNGANLNRAIGLAYSTFTNLTSNYNDLIVSGTGSAIGQTGTLSNSGFTASTTLANWQTNTVKDANSLNIAPVFISSTNLHLITSSNNALDGTGTPVAVTDDIDCDVRNVTTPDMGADEFTPPVITDAGATAIVLPVSFCAGSNPVSATVKNFGTTPLTSVLIDWSVTPGGAQPQVNPGAISIAPGASQTFLLGNFTFVPGTVYSITATTSSPNGGADGVPGNDAFTNANVQTGMSGTYTVGAGGNYPNLTAAIADYNSRSLCGPVVFSLTGSTYTNTSDTIKVNPAASATNTLTIKPTLANTTITGNSANATLVLLGADYVTIDGSIGSTANTVCPPSRASRDLTISNTNTGTASAVIWMATTATGSDAASNNKVINSNIIGNSNSTTIVGIGTGGTTIGSGTGALSNNNNQVINDSIAKVGYGIYFNGAVATKNTGTVISLNAMNTVAPNNIAIGGIFVGNDNGAVVEANKISGMNSGTDAFGISLGLTGWIATTTTSAEVINAIVSKNIIGQVQNTGTNSAAGILVGNALSGTNTISNNMIYGVIGNSTPGDLTAGILALGGTGSTTKVYYNTVSMTGDRGSGTTASSLALAIGGTDPVVDVRNNILINKQTTASTGKSYAIGTGSATFVNLTSNYNDLFVSGTSSQLGVTTALNAGTDQATLAAWQTATTKDANSLNTDATFVTSTDLHVVPASNVTLNAAGTPVSVTDDIDCELRDATTPDLGADEFTVTVCSGAVGGTANGTIAYCTSGSPTLSASGYSSGVGTTYTWLISTNAGATWTAGPGTNNNPAAYNPGAITQTTLIKLAVNCNNTSFDSSTVATITINPKPTVPVTPSNPAAVCAPATITLDASGTNASELIGFQWIKNGIAISGQTGVNFVATTSGSYRVRIQDGITGCFDTSVVVNVTINPLPAAVTITPSPVTICPGGSTPLTAGGGNISASGNAILGTATTLTGATTQPTAFCNRWAQYWNQTIYTAAELSAAGLIAGSSISAVTYTTTTQGDANDNTNFSISIGNTASTTLSAFQTTGLTTVYGPATYVHAVGANTITFSTPFVWDGTSNIVLDVRQDGVDNINNAITYFTAAADNKNIEAHTSTLSGTTTLQTLVSNATVTPTASTTRLNISLAYASVQNPAWSWSPALGLNTTTGASVIASPAATTLYTATATINGCTSSKDVTVTVLAADTLEWTGAVNTDWTNVGNWRCGVVPGITSNVIINSGLPNYPLVNLNVEVKSLFVKPGATVTLATGFEIKLNGN